MAKRQYETYSPMGARVLFAVGSVALSFFATVALLLVANFLTNLYADDGFAGLVQIRLRAVFYWRTLLILALSSIIYTPFSYGITFLFLRRACHGEVRVRYLFFALGAPLFLVKAVALKICVSGLMTFLSILVLLVVCLLQICILFPALLWQEIDLFSYGSRWLDALVRLFSDQQWFAVMTLLLWIITVMALLILRLRFALCKYALLRFPSFTVWEAVRVGLLATKGRVRYMLWHYIRLGAYWLLLTLSFFSAREKMRRFLPLPFSLWAVCQVDKARDTYFAEKNS